LESDDESTTTCVYSSGMAAIEAAFLSILDSSSNKMGVICSSKCYGGTVRWLEDVWKGRMKNEVWYVDLHSPKGLSLVEEILKMAEIRSYLDPPSSFIIFTEIVTNPLLSVLDPSPLLSFCASKPSVNLVIDNTLCSPCIARPLTWPGVSVVIESITKYINGHSDVISGSVSTTSPEISKHLKRIQNTSGAVPSPFDCYLVMRGMKTLDLRMRRQSENARMLAEMLEEERAKGRVIEKVNYPSLPGQCPADAKISDFANLSVGWGGVVSFELSSPHSPHLFLSSLRLFSTAESLGAVESLAEIPYEMMGFPNEEKALEKGVKKGLIRLSVGIEGGDDLLEDVRRAIEKLSENF